MRRSRGVRPRASAGRCEGSPWPSPPSRSDGRRSPRAARTAKTARAMASIGQPRAEVAQLARPAPKDVTNSPRRAATVAPKRTGGSAITRFHPLIWPSWTAVATRTSVRWPSLKRMSAAPTAEAMLYTRIETYVFASAAASACGRSPARSRPVRRTGTPRSTSRRSSAHFRDRRGPALDLLEMAIVLPNAHR